MQGPSSLNNKLGVLARVVVEACPALEVDRTLLLEEAAVVNSEEALVVSRRIATPVNTSR